MLLITLTLALLCLLVFVGCDESSKQENAKTKKLNTPVVTLSGNVASCGANLKAEKFEISLDGVLTYLENTVESYVLLDGQTFKVRAIGDGDNYSTSDWSNAVTYVAGTSADTSIGATTDTSDVTTDSSNVTTDTSDATTESGDTEVTPPNDEEQIVGNQVGNVCPYYDMEIFDENGLTGEIFNPANNDGKITIINFWGTWCGGCIEELPYFDQIATEYNDSVTVVAVHTHIQFDTAADYVMSNYKDSDMIFVKDCPINPDNAYSPEIYFKALGGGSSYPITIILDEKGVIISTNMKSTTYAELKNIIDSQLSK